MRSRLFQLTLIALLFFSLMLLAASPAQAKKPAAPNMDILTSTPAADGSIVHIVQQDESLATISASYGISMADLRSLNGMAPTSNLIFPGQKLIIRLPQPATATLTITATVPRPTRTPTPIIPTRTPRPTATNTPTLIPSPTTDPNVAALNGFWENNHATMLYAMIGVCVCGLLVTLWSGFRKTS